MPARFTTLNLRNRMKPIEDQMTMAEELPAVKFASTARINTPPIPMPRMEDRYAVFCKWINMCVRNSGGIVTFHHPGNKRIQEGDYSVRNVTPYGPIHVSIIFQDFNGDEQIEILDKWTKFNLFGGNL